MSKSNVTPVMFRKEPGGGILAVFPTVPASCDGRVSVYAHVGQHSGADWTYVTTKTRPAKPNEYAALARELRQVGYEVKPVDRRSSTMRGQFNAEVRRLCSRR